MPPFSASWRLSHAVAVVVMALPPTLILAEEPAARQTPLEPNLSRKIASGPLRIHPQNSRYFTDGTKEAGGALRATYLTGSHTWGNLCDYPPERYPAFD